MTTLLQQYLRANDGLSVDAKLSALVAKYSLAVKPHKSYPNLHQFKYDQINSPMHEPLVKECRGIILDQNDDWACVARPFDKFWNLGDFYADKVDWTKAMMSEKLDGSLIIMYFYDGKWNVATSGTPDASGQVNGFPMDFAKLFWDTFRSQGLTLDELDFYDSNYTFLFELMTPYNRVVVPHKTCSVKLIGIRNRNNGKEMPPLFGPKSWPYVKSIPILSDMAVLDTFTKINAIDQEGWVVTDDKFNRVKVKHPQYVVLHHMRGEGTPSPKRALQVILGGEHEEVLTYWPEWRPLFSSVASRLVDLTDGLNTAYGNISHLESQKEFALEAQKSRCSGALFMLRAKKVPDIYTYLKNMHIDNLASILKMDEIKPEIVSVLEAA